MSSTPLVGQNQEEGLTAPLGRGGATSGRPGASFSFVTRNSAISMAGGLISQGLKFLVMIYIARRFAVAEFGQLSFAMAVNAFMFVVSSFGLNIFGSRAVAKSGRVSRALLGEIFCLQAALGLLGTALALGVLMFAPAVSRMELWLVAWFGLSNVVLAGMFDWAFQGLHRQAASAALNILWQGAWLSFTVAGIHWGLGVTAVPVGLCLSALLAAGSSYVGLRRTGFIERDPSPPTPLLRRSWMTLQIAGPLGWGILLITVLVWSDAIAVRLLHGDRAVGLYAAGNRAVLAVAMLGTYYVQGAFPLLSQSSENPVAFERCFSRTYAELSALFLPGAVWAFYFAKEIIELLFHRADYVAAVPVFRVFQLSLPLFVANNLIGTGVLLAWHRDRKFRTVLGGTAAIFAVLCTALTWRWGIVGAAMAVLISQSVSWVWFRHEAAKLVRLRWLRPLLRPVAAGLAVVLCCYFLHLSLLAGLFPLVIVQFALCTTLRQRAAV